jgi:hypothetical protein
MVFLLLLPLWRAGAASAADFAGPRVERWQRVPLQAPGSSATALALAGDRLAAGHGGGVAEGPVDGPLSRLLWRGPVLGLAYLADGGLLAATAVGLYWIGPERRVERVRVGTGDASRAVTHVAVEPGLAAVATLGGVYVSAAGRRWSPIASLPIADASLVAVRRRPSGHEVWSVIDRELWITAVRLDRGLIRAGPSRRLRVPFAPLEEAPVDVVFDLPGAETALLFPSLLVVRAGADRPWQVLRPILPPGATARRVAHALGRFWLATDSGLLDAETLAGPWQRSVAPAGGREVRAVVGDADTLHVATAGDLLRAVVVAPLSAPPARAEGAGSDPPIGAVHRAAIAYQGLDPGRMEALRRGAGRRGWLPVVSFRVAHQDDHARSDDWDQQFASGETRHLYDRDQSSGRDLDLSLTLSWDLGDVVFLDDEIAVSRESRSVIQLRDDVLDEVTQLYFERRRVLTELASVGAASERAPSLRLRAAELAAGLDAWTGGWFTRHARAPSARAQAP